jgi:hypothetical protein
MPVTSFNNQVLSAFGLAPLNLNYSLSSAGTYKTVELLTVGTVNGKQVKGIVFNTLTSPASGNGVFATLSAFSGTTLRVDTAYQGRTMAVVCTDDSSSLFTVVTGATTTKQTLTSNDFNTTYPDIVREVYLGYR